MKLEGFVLVLPIGTEVVIGGSINATIVGIGIESNDRVQYLVRWFNDRHLVKDWFDVFEVEPVDESKAYKVGFAKPDNPSQEAQ